MSGPRGILKLNSHTSDKRGGGMLPAYRTTYTLQQRTALWELAMSNPTWQTYHAEKARILGDA